MSSDFVADNDASFNLSCPTHYHILHQIVEYGYVDFFTNLTIMVSNDKRIHFVNGLEFDGWPWKTIRHLFYATLNFVHHFKAIGEFKLKLQSGNAQFGSKWTIFFVPCDLAIWRMTLNNNRAHRLCCSSFMHHFVSIGESNWSYSPKMPNLSPNRRFFSRVTLKFDGWPWKTIEHLS